jgi:hypothetical protein
MSSYYLNDTHQIISPLGQVVADCHGSATVRGRRDAETMLRALNHEPARLQTLRRLRALAEVLSESGEATEDNFRRLAGIVAELTEEAAR